MSIFEDDFNEKYQELIEWVEEISKLFLSKKDI